VRQDSQPTLRKHDWIILPLISLATILFVCGGAEWLARILWPENITNTCIADGQPTNVHFKPNCAVRLKMWEGPQADYHYNECGYRSMDSCRPKAPGVIRVVIIGSSISEGLYIPYDKTFFSIASKELARTCNRRIDVQPVAAPSLTPAQVYSRIDETLALKPDIVVFLFNPHDIFKIDPGLMPRQSNSENASSPPQDDSKDEPAPARLTLWGLVDTAIRSLHLRPPNIFQNPTEHIRAAAVAQHFRFQDRDSFLRSMDGAEDEYLRRPLTLPWQRRLSGLDLILGEIADKLRAAEVPFVVVPVPSRKEAALLSSAQLPPYIDPLAFGREVEMMATRHGAVYVDLMKAFSRIPNAERLFYAVDTHPNADAQPVISQVLVQKLQDGSIPAFSHCDPQQTAERVHQP
jgi:hypothetical protein